MSLTIPIILGTLREGRQGLRAARFVMRRLAKHPSLLPVPEGGKALDQEGHARDPRLDGSAMRFIAELGW